MGEPLMEVRDLAKHFAITSGGVRGRTRGNLHAVDGVSFSIEPGTTLALVGESGCGKTTTARLVLRLHTPTSGRVLLEGRDVHLLKGRELRWYRTSVQAVFQDPWASLSPRMRVRNFVAEPLIVNRRLPKEEIRERVGTTLEKVGMQRWHGDLFPHEFSGGQRQRIALASALVTEPRLLVLDEPASALDVSVQAQVVNLLQDIQAEVGTAFLLISHDLATVRHIAHDVAVMYMGRIVEIGDAERIFGSPRHPYTRRLFEATLPTHPRERRPHLEIRGEVSEVAEAAAGWRFDERCEHAAASPAEPPELVEVDPGHRVECHLSAA